MKSPPICPVCGASVSSDAPRGLCPQCLMGQALGVHDLESPKSKVQNPRSPEVAGRDFADYELLGELAQGGMGVVYYARQISLNRIVALKMIRSGQLATTSEVQRFRTEAEAAANLDHPNIVPIYEIGEHAGQHYFSMKLIEGETLAELNAECGTRNAEWQRTVCALIAKLARAVHHAHQRGVLHRDLKPTNILLDEQGEPHLTDFGLAKLVLGRPDFTQSLAILGTPGYMSPEQAAGRTKELTTSADIYSLGAILYELLAGRAPFQADSTLELLKQVQTKEPEHPRKFNPGVDRDLATICLKCLEKEPQRRYGTAEALAQELECWRRGEPIQARPSKAWERGVKWARRNPVVAGLSTAAALMLLLGAGGVVLEWRQAATQALRADANARDSRHLLAKSYIANGTRAANEGDSLSSLVWFAEALPLDSDSAARAANDRLRLSTALRCAPRLLQWFPHGSSVEAVQFSSDGKRILAAGFRGSVIVWDAETGQQLFEPLRHRFNMYEAEFVQHDRAILTMTYGGDGARLWDAQRGELRYFFEHNKGRWAACSADGQWLLTGGADGAIKLWNALSGELVGPLLQHGTMTFDGKFSPDGRRFATGSSDHTVIIWDRESMKPALPPLQCEDEVWSVNFNPAGTRLATVSFKRSVQIWDASTGKAVTPPLPHKGADSCVFSPDGAWLANASFEGTIRIWNSESGQMLFRELVHPGVLSQINFDREAHHLAVGCADGAAYLWDLTRQEPVSTQFRHGRGVISVCFSPDDRRLLTGSSDGTARLWDCQSAALCLNPWAKPPVAVLDVGNENRLLTQNQDGSVQLWDTKTWSAVSPAMPMSNHTSRAWLSPDETKLVIECLVPNRSAETVELQVLRLQSGQQERSMLVQSASSVRRWISPDARLLALSDSNSASICELSTRKQLWHNSFTNEMIQAIVFSPEGGRMAVLGARAYLLDSRTGERTFRLVTPLGHAIFGSFSSDGKWLAGAFASRDYNPRSVCLGCSGRPTPRARIET